jgi:hypothetical protein
MRNKDNRFLAFTPQLQEFRLEDEPRLCIQ